MRVFLFAVSIVGALTIAYEAFAQGPLTPSGAPAPTMKTLQQVEPRTPIGALPYDITQPGSYYLTGPLFSTNYGIRIFSHDVTVDLMGFTITGTANPMLPGIHVVANNVTSFRNIVVRNGGISEFGHGVFFENVVGGAIRDMTIAQNSGVGIYIFSTNLPCRSVVVENNSITDNAGVGIQISTVGSASANNGHVIRGNALSGNGEFGIRMSFCQGVLVDGNVIGPQVGIDTYGIRAISSRGLVVRNFENGNSNAYVFTASSDTVGPVVNVGGTLLSTGTQNHAWANFSR